MWGHLRGASWYILGEEQSSRGGGESDVDKGGNPLPRGQGGVDGGVVVGIEREKALPSLSWKRDPPVLASLYLV